MTIVVALAVFAVFLVMLWLQARHQRRRTVAGPRWWLPAAVWVAVLIVTFLVVTTSKHGWRWNYLLVIPIIGGSFAVAAGALSWAARRRFR